MKNYCNFCPHASVVNFTSTQRRYNLSCEHEKGNRIVEVSVNEGNFVQKPTWCPLKTTSSVATSSNKKNESLSYQEKLELLKNMKPLMKWEDIKVNKIYHVPQIPGEERKDIIITHKNDYSCTYKVIDSSYNISYTIFPSTLMSKFLVEHKIISFKEKK